MTELEKMQRAKVYIDKLANGIDPLSDTQVSNDDVINQVEVSRCLFYVSDVLRKLIENGGFNENSHKTEKQAFFVTPEELSNYKIERTPIPVSEIAKRINDLVDPDAVTKLEYSSITSFLLQSGFLVEYEYSEGRKTKIPTGSGKSIGISREERLGQYGPYYVTVYNSEAQQFILDNINAIIEINASKKKQ